MKNLLLLIFLLPSVGLLAQKWEKNFDFVDQCTCGLAKVKKDNKIGYVDKEGKVMIPLEYAEGLSFNEGYVAVRKDAKWLYLDSTGKAITEAIFEDAMSFEGGLAVVSKDGMYGYINTKGETAINFLFRNARNFSEDLAPATNAKGFWGFIDKKGSWVIKPQYDFADNFAAGEAKVMKGDKSFYIDKANKMLHE